MESQSYSCDRGETMEYLPIDSKDRELIEAAIDVIRRNYKEGRHSVGAAVLCSSGEIYTGVNIDSSGYGPCAEPIAIGAAVSHGEREFLSIVAVGGWEESYPLMSPCGNCRQMLIDYAPEAMVILEHNGKPVKTKASNLLPSAYRHRETSYC